MINRRTFFLGGCALAGISASGFGANAQTNSRPNILFILADDLGRAQVGAYNRDLALSQVDPATLEAAEGNYNLQMAMDAARRATPCLDQMAAEGMRFEHVIAAPSCAPSRLMLMTGRYPQSMGIYGNDDIYVKGLPPEAVCVSEVLKAGGYQTALIGKWHKGERKVDGRAGVADRAHPLDRGFDYFFGFLGAETEYYGSKDLWRNREFPVPAEGYLTDQLTDEALGQIERFRVSKDPFFMYLAYNAPHGPIRKIPEKYKSGIGAETQYRENYYGTIQGLDMNIRRVLDYLRESGLEKNTVVVFASDNGAPSWTPAAGNAPFRGFKHNTDEGGVRVPMLVRWPGHVPEGTVHENPISFIDLFPTLLDAAGLKGRLPAETDGGSVWDVFLGKSAGPEGRTLFWMGYNGPKSLLQEQEWKAKGKAERQHWLSYSQNTWFAVRGDWKLYNRGLGKIELYNVKIDPAETTDRAAEFPETVQDMRRSYQRWAQQTAPPLQWPRSNREELLH